MMFKAFKIALLSCCLCAFVADAQARTIRYNNDMAEKEQYLVGMLKLAIKKSGDPSLKLEPAGEVMTEAKTMAELEAGNVGVMWGIATKDMEARFKPIRIPLVKGLLGYRLFIIKQGEQYKFDGIKTFQDLTRLTAGQGRTWGDTQILANAGIPLATSIKYENLFYMLEGGRFDYFPRGAHEPWSEVSSNRDLNLTVEKNMMLVYPLAMVFYVNRSDAELAYALEKGLELAIEDGSFDEYFYGNPLIQSALKQSNLKQRNVFRIENPFLPVDMPLDRKELWLDINAIP